MTYAFHTPDKLCFILDLMNGKQDVGSLNTLSDSAVLLLFVSGCLILACIAPDRLAIWVFQIIRFPLKFKETFHSLNFQFNFILKS